MRFLRVNLSGALLSAVIATMPAAAQPCVSGTGPYIVDEIKKSVFIISPASNLNTVLGTATLVHRDGLFVTAAHTMIDYDPTSLVLHRPSAGGYKTSFKPTAIVYPAAGPCPNATAEQNRCRYRTSEKRVLDSMPSNDAAWKDNLDFALIKIDKPLPDGIAPVPLRRSGFAEDNVKLWGFPGDPKLGPPGYDLRTVDARYTGRAGGIPFYTTDLYANGLSGSLAVDGRGLGFGVLRKRKGDAGQITLDGGYSLPVVEDANLMIVVPFDAFVKAGLFDGFSAPRVQHFINIILNGVQDGYSTRTRYVTEPSVLSKLQAEIQAEVWTLFDYLHIAEVEKQIAKLEPNAWAKRFALAALPLSIAATTCEATAAGTYVENAIELLNAPETRLALASGNFEARSAVMYLASAAGWGTVAGEESDLGQRFAQASVSALYDGALTDSTTIDQRRAIAEWGIEANTKVGNWKIWNSDTQPAILAAQVNSAPHVWDRIGYWHLGQGDAASAAVAFLKTEKQLIAAADAAPDSTAISKFTVVSRNNFTFALNQLANEPDVDRQVISRLGRDDVTFNDFAEIADRATLALAARER